MGPGPWKWTQINQGQLGEPFGSTSESSATLTYTEWDEKKLVFGVLDSSLNNVLFQVLDDQIICVVKAVSD